MHIPDFIMHAIIIIIIKNLKFPLMSHNVTLG